MGDKKHDKNSVKMHSGHIEVAVSRLLNYRKHAIVPNVSWGLGLRHECDMLVLDDQNRFTEVEIKISAADLKADFKKEHGHKSKIISRLIYAMPLELCEKYSELIPKGCGIIAVKQIKEGDVVRGYIASWYRMCKHDKSKEKPTASIIRKFLELGCMRIWTLKRHNNNRNEQRTSA